MTEFNIIPAYASYFHLDTVSKSVLTAISFVGAIASAATFGYTCYSRHFSTFRRQPNCWPMDLYHACIQTVSWFFARMVLLIDGIVRSTTKSGERTQLLYQRLWSSLIFGSWLGHKALACFLPHGSFLGLEVESVELLHPRKWTGQ